MKERIIGAIVLVAVVVLVVPVFLDGPPGDSETVTERVPLPGQSDQKMQTVVLDRDRADPVPSRAPDRDDAPDEDAAGRTVTLPVAATPEPAERPADNAAEPVAEAASTPASAAPSVPAESSTGMWAVQLGSFSRLENAENLAAGLRRQGFAAFLSQLDTENGVRHRVRIGPQGDRAAAEAMAARLAEAGHDGQVVPHP